MDGAALNLALMVDQADGLRQLRKKDLCPGDWVLVKTYNSQYAIRILGNGICLVSGGWFDRNGVSPMRTRVTGCTWGGSAIKVDIVAACGLCLEFGNRVVTTPIRKILVLPHGCEN